MVMLEKQTCLNFGAGDHSSSNSFSFGSSDTNDTTKTNTNTSNTPVSFSFGSTPNNTTNHQNTSTTGTTGFSFGEPSTTSVPNNNQHTSTAGFGTFGGSTSTATAPSFVSTSTGTTSAFGASQPATTNTQGGFGTAPSTSLPTSTTTPSFGFTSLPSTTTVTTGASFGASQPAKSGFNFGTTSFNTTQAPAFGCFSVQKPLPVNNGEYISLNGPLGSYLIKQCADLCDLEIQILDNGTLHSTFSCNRVFFIGLSDKFDRLVKNKCVKKSEMYVLTISPEEFRSHLGVFNVQVLTNLFECIIMGSTQVHVNNSFHLLTLLIHLDLLNTMRILRDLICYSFTQQHALLFATKFNNYYTEGHSYNVEMMSLFLTSINNVISGIDKITNQIAFGKINYNLLERFLSSTSKTASLRCIFQAIDIWIENNKTFASDPIQIATLLDSIQLESPKDHAQIISTISCYPSRFQFLNMLDPVMRLKLVYKHALLIK